MNVDRDSVTIRHPLIVTNRFTLLGLISGEVGVIALTVIWHNLRQATQMRQAPQYECGLLLCLNALYHVAYIITAILL